MSAKRPSSIRWFEALSIASLAVGLTHQFAVSDVGFAGAIAEAAIVLTLTLLVSRLRQNWARWVLAMMFVIGTVFMIAEARSVLALGYPIIIIGVTLMQISALALLFTSKSTAWFRDRSAAIGTFD